MKIINQHNSHSVYGSSMSVTRCSSLQPFVSDSSERACVYTTTAEVEQSDAKCRNREPATGRALQTLIAASARTAGGGFADHSPGGADVCRCP